ncbi:MAG: phosphatase PAP2 family protein [Alphaproteobacteria bacterium]|nr:phosphatase PAP2 family protein [Alphaproteobacteria bacterium]
MTKAPSGFNEKLFMQINAGADAPHWMIGFATVAAKYLVILVPLVLAFMWLTGDSKKRGVAIEAFLVTCVSLAIGGVIAAAYPHPRPFAVGLGHQYLPHAPNASFPSDHATFFAAAAFALLAGRCWIIGGAVFAVGVVVSWARIYLGVHYPMDMAGAVLVAVLGQMAVSPLWKKFGDKLTALAEKIYRRLLKPAIDRGWLKP